MAKVQFTGGGITSPSGISGSIQFNNAGAFGSDASNLFWDDTNNRLGVGINLPLATIHAKGANDSSGSSAIIQSATYELINAYNNRQVVIGGGSAATTTALTINPGGVGALSTDYTLKIIGASGDNSVYVSNGNGSTNAGMFIHRSALGIARRALTIVGGGTDSLWITSNGSIAISPNGAGTLLTDEIGSNGIINSSVAGSRGLFFVTSGSNRGFIFNKIGAGSANDTQAAFQIRKDFTEAAVSSYTERLCSLNGTYSLTNGTKNLIGIDYEVSVTLSGLHYGLLIRPSNSLNGFGLGATLPTAVLDIAASTTATSSFRIRSGTAPTSPNDGDIWYDGTNLKMRIGALTKTFTIV